MNWDAIVAVAELGGAIAVVITLYYLSGQIRQSNKIARRMTNMGALIGKSCAFRPGVTHL